MQSGRFTLYVAVSVDGFLADDDGGVAWLEEFGGGSGDAADAYEAFLASVDCLVVGAATYEQVRSFGEWTYEDRPTYVLTHRELGRATDAVEFVDGDVDSVAAELGREYDHVWVVGGAQVARAFLRAHRIDRLRLTLIPVLLGSGIPLFTGGGETHPLTLLDTRAHASGMVELHYEVRR
jgi:dihydrofolate reductase